MSGTTLKTLGLVAILAAGAVYMHYGTLSPCGALRETVRRENSLARILPDSVVDAFIQENSGSLSPGRCVALLMGQRPPAPTIAAASAAPAPQSGQAAPAQANPLQAPLDEAVAAINECKAKRLSGELKDFVQSAQCSNPRIIAAFKKANYRYLDLIAIMTTRRMLIAERLDQHQISEADANVANQQALADIITAENARDAKRSNKN